MEPEELEAAARRVLRPEVYAYYAGGADDELTVADNLAAWQRLRLRPHVLRDVSRMSTRARLLGSSVTTPVAVAPTACHGLAHADAEAATATGAAAAGALMIASTISNLSLEAIAATAPDAPRWFQLYVRQDRAWASELIRRAEAAGYRAVVVTVDLPIFGRRRRSEDSSWKVDVGELGNMADPAGVGDMGDVGKGGEADATLGKDRYAVDPSFDFDDFERICSSTRLPVVAKGVLRGDDARGCVAAGAAGVVVSNHGGRQLDGSVATADALAEVVQAVGADAEVYVDGGVRRGGDVLKALALGARAVLVGRPVLWGLAVDGSEGVRGVLDRLNDELIRAMALCGARELADLTVDLVVPPAGHEPIY